MTLFEITAVAEADQSRSCCPDAVRAAGIGRAHGLITAREVRDDLRGFGRGCEYYAMIESRYREVVAVDCPECGQSRLTTATRFAARDELAALPTLDASAFVTV